MPLRKRNEAKAPTKTKRHHRIDEYRYLDKRLSISASGNTELPQKRLQLIEEQLVMRKRDSNLVIFRTLILLANLHILFGLSKRKSRIFTILANILYLWSLSSSFLLYLQSIM